MNDTLDAIVEESEAAPKRVSKAKTQALLPVRGASDEGRTVMAQDDDGDGEVSPLARQLDGVVKSCQESYRLIAEAYSGWANYAAVWGRGGPEMMEASNRCFDRAGQFAFDTMMLSVNAWMQLSARAIKPLVVSFPERE